MKYVVLLLVSLAACTKPLPPESGSALKVEEVIRVVKVREPTPSLPIVMPPKPVKLTSPQDPQAYIALRRSDWLALQSNVYALRSWQSETQRRFAK